MPDTYEGLSSLLSFGGGTRRSSPRDNQRKRIYDAGDLAAAKLGQIARGRSAGGESGDSRTIDNGDLQGWVDEAMARPAVQRRWKLDRNRVQVDLKRGGAAYGYRFGADCAPYRHRITLPLFSRNPWVVLHEVAHCLTPDGYAPHGSEFAGVWLFLVEAVMGKEAGQALREAFREKRVRKNTKAIPAPTYAVVTKADRQAQASAAKRRAREAAKPTPLTASERAALARLLTAAADTGLFRDAEGRATSYQRQARTLAKIAEAGGIERAVLRRAATRSKT